MGGKEKERSSLKSYSRCYRISYTSKRGGKGFGRQLGTSRARHVKFSDNYNRIAVDREHHPEKNMQEKISKSTF